MALGRIVHYAVDAVLVSTVVAGIRRSSGFAWASQASCPASNTNVNGVRFRQFVRSSALTLLWYQTQPCAHLPIVSSASAKPYSTWLQLPLLIVIISGRTRGDSRRRLRCEWEGGHEGLAVIHLLEMNLSCLSRIKCGCQRRAQSKSKK